jgi:hypothetical protein
VRSTRPHVYGGGWELGLASSQTQARVRPRFGFESRVRVVYLMSWIVHVSYIYVHVYIIGFTENLARATACQVLRSVQVFAQSSLS